MGSLFLCGHIPGGRREPVERGAGVERQSAPLGPGVARAGCGGAEAAVGAGAASANRKGYPPFSTSKQKKLCEPSSENLPGDSQQRFKEENLSQKSIAIRYQIRSDRHPTFESALMLDCPTAVIDPCISIY
jgi:hypothetical protein